MSPEHAFLSEELRSWVELELFDGRPTSECKQLQRLFIGQLPLLCDVEKDAEAAGPSRRCSLSTRKSGTGRRSLSFSILSIDSLLVLSIKIPPIYTDPLNWMERAQPRTTGSCVARGPPSAAHPDRHYAITNGGNG